MKRYQGLKTQNNWQSNSMIELKTLKNLSLFLWIIPTVYECNLLTHNIILSYSSMKTCLSVLLKVFVTKFDIKLQWLLEKRTIKETIFYLRPN